MAQGELRGWIPVSAVFTSWVQGIPDGPSSRWLCAYPGLVLPPVGRWLVPLEDAGQARDHCGGQHPACHGQRPGPVQQDRALRLPGAFLAKPDDRQQEIERVDGSVECRWMRADRDHVGWVGAAEHPGAKSDERGQPYGSQPCAVAVSNGGVPEIVEWVERVPATPLLRNGHCAGSRLVSGAPVSCRELVIQL